MRIRHFLGVSWLFPGRLAALGLLTQALVLPLAGCGGGGDGGGSLLPSTAGPNAGNGFLLIVNPASGAYQADQHTVTLGGNSFIPAGASCFTFPQLPPAYQVTWSNNSTGATGNASRGLNCFLFVFVFWNATNIPLAIGANSITVTAIDGAGNVGRDTIVVTRLPDTAPPQVSTTSPLNGANGIAVESSILAIFSEPVDPATINAATFLVRDSSNNPVGGAVTSSGNQATFTPFNPLAPSTVYTATVGSGVKDLDGLAMPADYAWSFTTGANLWQGLSLQNAPSARTDHTGVWTGTHLVVWGGRDGTDFLRTGGTIDPDSGFGWGSTVTVTAPTKRSLHTAVWTGTEMVVWGGFNGSYLNDGGRLAPFTLSNPWRSVSLIDAPSARARHTAVWTGSEMIAWGGEDSNGRLNTGARYSPGTDSWQAVVGGPPARALHSAIWTGTQMVIWGGADGSQLLAGGAGFNPATNGWQGLSPTGAPVPRAGHTAVWTGTEMIIWGGWNNNSSAPVYFNDGARYNPQTDSWAPLATTGAPSPRTQHTAVWTGSEMIVWGGTDGAALFDTGARYNPSTNMWNPLSMNTAPDRRMNHTAHWTGTEMLIWGGVDGTSLHNTGGRYQP